MASFAEAIRGNRNVFLANPAWRASEREELERIVGSGKDAGDRGWLMIPSGGAGGGLKFARHDGWTVAAAVEGFRRHFDMDRVNAVSVKRADGRYISAVVLEGRGGRSTAPRRSGRLLPLACPDAAPATPHLRILVGMVTKVSDHLRRRGAGLGDAS
jgi:hypothetical protein